MTRLTLAPNVVLELGEDAEGDLVRSLLSLVAGSAPPASAGASDEDPWLSVKSAATYLDCPPSRVYALKAQGLVRYAKDGSTVKFRRSWLDAYMEAGCDR